MGSGFDTVIELCKDSKVSEGFSIKGGIERNNVYLALKDEKRKEAQKEVKKWLRRIKLNTYTDVSRVKKCLSETVGSQPNKNRFDLT